MSEVAGLRARPRDDLGVLHEHAVELRHQRREFAREAAFHPLRLAVAHASERGLQLAQRRQADEHLQQRRQRQPESQDAQRQPELALEAGDRLDHQALVGSDDQLQRPVFERQAALHRTQHRSPRADDPVLVNLAVSERVRRDGQRLIPQGARTQRGPRGRNASFGEPVNLPVETGERLVEARIAERQVQRGPALVVDLQMGGQLVQMGLQLRVELGGDVLMKQPAQPPAGDEDGRGDPEQRAEEQAEAQRGQ